MVDAEVDDAFDISDAALDEIIYRSQIDEAIRQSKAQENNNSIRPSHERANQPESGNLPINLALSDITSDTMSDAISATSLGIEENFTKSF